MPILQDLQESVVTQNILHCAWQHRAPFRKDVGIGASQIAQCLKHTGLLQRMGV